MKITRDNYEVFFLDYLDGNLEEKDMDQFLDFLEQNADLKEELRSLEYVRLPEEMAVMHGKNQLYKTSEDEITANENKLVAYLEGDLEEDNRKLVASLLAENPDLRKEYSILEQTRLKPDPAIYFANKRKLYKKPASVVAMNWVARVAAVVVLVWGLSFVFRSQQSPDTILSSPEIAQAGQKTVPQEKTTEAVKPVNQEPKTIEAASKVEKIKPVKKKIVQNEHSESLREPVIVERESLSLAKIEPLGAQLQERQSEVQLAFARTPKIESGQEPPQEMDIPEFLADRAKRVGNEGVRSFQRLARLGLGLASEISGERISYSEKDGKISSVEFESKLLAFTIPLEKK